MHLLMAGTTAPSHVYPSLALIAELVARGHRVSYLIGDRLAELVASTGAEVIAHPTRLPDGDTAWPEDVGEAMQIFLDESIAVLPRVLERDRPDAVLYDIGGFAGHVAAHQWGVPAIQLSPTYVAWEGYEEDMAEFTSTLKASPSGRRYYATLRGWLDANEIALDADAFLGRPDACVVLIPRVIQPNEERVSGRYVFAGPCIEAARTQPQLDVLEHADVFITHAGMGGTVESLWFGVPTVAIPQAVDQFTNAAQLEAIRAGVQLGERDLREAVAAAQACAPRASELSGQVRANGGPDKAADAVERLVA